MKKVEKVKEPIRPERTLTAYNDEWEVIKEFVYLIREIGAEKAREIIRKGV